jgi:site-specific recombinase XerD
MKNNEIILKLLQSIENASVISPTKGPAAGLSKLYKSDKQNSFLKEINLRVLRDIFRKLQKEKVIEVCQVPIDISFFLYPEFPIGQDPDDLVSCFIFKKLENFKSYLKSLEKDKNFIKENLIKQEEDKSDTLSNKDIREFRVKTENKNFENINNAKILSDYENYLISNGKSENTISAYISEAYKLLKNFKEKDIILSDIKHEGIFDYLSEAKKGRNLSTNSYSRLTIAIRGFLSFLYSNEIIVKDISLSLKTPKKEDKKREVLSTNDIEIIEKYFRERIEKFKTENLRDIIIFYLGIKCGLRKSEIINLDWEDIDFNNSEIKIIGSKGGNDRIVYFNDVLKKILQEYKQKTGSNSDAIVRGKNGNRLCSNSLQNAIRRLYSESGLYRSGLTIHSLRHTYAETLRKQGFDFSVIQALLGHKSLETTAKYLHVTKDDLKKAVL